MIAEGLLDAGCEVIITGRKVEQVTAAADEMSTRGTCIAVPSDLPPTRASTPCGRYQRPLGFVGHSGQQRWCIVGSTT